MKDWVILVMDRQRKYSINWHRDYGLVHIDIGEAIMIHISERTV